MVILSVTQAFGKYLVELELRLCSALLGLVLEGRDV
jgi:hypothetical protein